MPTAEDNKWDSQYKTDFRPRRYPRQVPKRPSSPTRRNNPHPPRDFIEADRRRAGGADAVQNYIRSAIARYTGQGGALDVKDIPVGRLCLSAREPARQLDPHWSQWPDDSRTPRPHSTLCLTPRAPDYSQAVYPPPISSQLNPPTPEPDMNRGERDVIMNRGLSPRRAPPPTMPGRSLTQYGGAFGGNRAHNSNIGALDLYATPYNANRGFNQGFTDYSTRQSRPMHRHMRHARKGEDYLHNESIFYSTTPNVTGYFIIHPDWVSERLTLRRSASMLAF